MNIIIFGAAGEIGRRTTTEATSRGHTVSAVARRAHDSAVPGVRPIRYDAESQDDARPFIRGHDLVITALRPRDGEEPKLLPLTARIVEAAIAEGVRFLVVGGAAALRMPDQPNHTVLTAPGFLPDEHLAIATACQIQHDWCLPRLGNLGSYLCPPAMLTPGERTGAYRTGSDTLLTDSEGRSRISMEDFAVALLDEAERPAHSGERFTVAY